MIKQLVNTFSSVASENCLLILEEHLLKHLSNLKTVFNLLTDLAVFSSWTFYTLTFIGVMKYRKDRPDLHRTYRVPGYPVVPLIAIAGGIYIIINQLFLSGMRAWLMSVFSILLTLVGLPVYYAVQRGKKKKNIG